jgi:hypothetical protein
LTEWRIVSVMAGLCMLVCPLLSVAVHVTGFGVSVVPGFVAVNVYEVVEPLPPVWVVTCVPPMYQAQEL